MGVGPCACGVDCDVVHGRECPCNLDDHFDRFVGYEGLVRERDQLISERATAEALAHERGEQRDEMTERYGVLRTQLTTAEAQVATLTEALRHIAGGHGSPSETAIDALAALSEGDEG